LRIDEVNMAHNSRTAKVKKKMKIR